jgi:adenylate kinase family enzyme
VSIKKPVLTSSILLLGPTGVGKSPLGNQIEKKGVNGKRCFHFDFGHELRRIAEHGLPPEGFQEKDLSFIRDVLDKGSLLENEHFHIAEKIICRFLSRNDFQNDDILILNGLPRHVAQAKDLNGIAAVERLVVLECKPDEIYKRIELNSGGDRTGRLDDSLAMIRKKLEIFKARTSQLIEYYSNMGCDILIVDIAAASTPEDTYNAFITECGC